MLGQDCNREWTTLGEMRLISERASEKVAVTSRNQERPWTTMRLSRGCDRLTNRRRWNRRVVTVANVVDSSYYLAFVCAGLTISYVLTLDGHLKTSWRLRRGKSWISVGNGYLETHCYVSCMHQRRFVDVARIILKAKNLN